MNIRQRIALSFGLLLEAGIVLYPPWFAKEKYGLIFSPPPTYAPRGNWDGPPAVSSMIDFRLLTIQCLVVALITLAVVVMLGSSREQNE
jgi:hypothetical protein